MGLWAGLTGRFPQFDILAARVYPELAMRFRSYILSNHKFSSTIDVNDLAKILDRSKAEAISLLLQASHVGATQFRFESFCPSCKSVHKTCDNLKDMDTKGACVECQKTYYNVLDQNVVAYFSVHPSINAKHSQSDPDKAIPASEVVNCQEFRTLFGGNLLAPGKGMAIGSVTLMFTDMSDSTATFSRRGDLDAFRLVREHFDLLFIMIKRNNGAVVKTIGDAVMAVFVHPQDGVRCALDIREEFDKFNARSDIAGDSYLKIGLHEGPSIAVTLNRVLDYFGTTANMASRVQGVAQKREIVLSSQVRNHPGVVDMLARASLRPVARETTLKGIIGPQTVYGV